MTVSTCTSYGRQISRSTRNRVSEAEDSSCLVERFCLDPVHRGLHLELMACTVVPGVGRLTTARAGMNLTHHGAVGLLGRPRLDGITVCAADGIRSLHDPVAPFPSRTEHYRMCSSGEKSDRGIFPRCGERLAANSEL